MKKDGDNLIKDKFQETVKLYYIAVNSKKETDKKNDKEQVKKELNMILNAIIKIYVNLKYLIPKFQKIIMMIYIKFLKMNILSWLIWVLEPWRISAYEDNVYPLLEGEKADKSKKNYI